MKTLEMSTNELSHYESLKRQDVEHRKLINKLQLEIKELKQIKIHGEVSNSVCPQCGCNKITGDGSKAWCLNEQCGFVTNDC